MQWGSKNLSFVLLKILKDVKEPWPPYWLLGFSEVAVGDWNHRGPVMKQFHTTAYALQCQSCNPFPTLVGKLQHAVRRKLDFYYSLPCVSIVAPAQSGESQYGRLAQNDIRKLR